MAQYYRQIGSAVMPVFFHGKNSPLFHIVGLVHPLIRSALLPRERLKKRSDIISYKIGHQISYKRLSDIESYDVLTSYLRFRTELLGKSGKSIDLDRFDHTYIHIFLWNEKNNEVVGSYRLGRIDEILAREGKRGLYTYTLFKYRDFFQHNSSLANISFSL